MLNDFDKGHTQWDLVTACDKALPVLLPMIGSVDALCQIGAGMERPAGSAVAAAVVSTCPQGADVAARARPVSDTSQLQASVMAARALR